MDQQQSIPFQASTSLFSQVLFFFGLAILTSAAGTYLSFQYLVPTFLSSPAWIYAIFAVELGLVLTSRYWSTKKPLNYFLFATFAFVTGMTLGPLLASIIYEFGGPDIIVKAFLSTTLVFTAAAIFGHVTNYDLTGFRGFLAFSLIGMLVISIIGIFVPWGSTFEIVFSGFGVLLFAGYTMYDFQKLKMYPADRAIDAALMLYLDIFNLFIYILRLLSGISRRQ